jgi:hypothetical protein
MHFRKIVLIFWKKIYAICLMFKKIYFFLTSGLLTQVQGGSNMTGTNCDLFTHK